MSRRIETDGEKKKKRKTKHKIKWWMMVLGRMYICRKKGSKQNKKKDFHILKNEVFPFRFTFPIPLSVCVCLLDGTAHGNRPCGNPYACVCVVLGG